MSRRPTPLSRAGQQPGSLLSLRIPDSGRSLRDALEALSVTIDAASAEVRVSSICTSARVAPDSLLISGGRCAWSAEA